MCLIVVKPKGVSLPKRKKMRQWFATHPDGFGLAFLHNGQVRILKGAMNIKQMSGILNKMDTYLDNVSSVDVDIVFHFRQATHGQKSPANCHPFPLTKEQDALASPDVLTRCAVAHNGILWGYNLWNDNYSVYGSYNICGDQCIIDTDPTEDKTDTQEFIEDYLVDLGDSLWNPAVQRLVGAYTESKFALLSDEGFVLIGKFTEDKGCWFSNDGYKPLKSAPTNEAASVVPFVSRGEDCCDGCLTYCSPLYYMPKDENSRVCYPCFQHFCGRLPKDEEQANQQQRR